MSGCKGKRRKYMLPGGLQSYFERGIAERNDLQPLMRDLRDIEFVKNGRLSLWLLLLTIVHKHHFSDVPAVCAGLSGMYMVVLIESNVSRQGLQSTSGMHN